MSMKRNELFELHKELTTIAREIIERKNADYGANDDPFANFRMSALLHIQPEFGVLLRMQDKMARLISFIEKGNLQVKEESWKDACLDLINYTVILCGLLQEKATTPVEPTPTVYSTAPFGAWCPKCHNITHICGDVEWHTCPVCKLKTTVKEWALWKDPK